jgi:hypothetical protein
MNTLTWQRVSVKQTAITNNILSEGIFGALHLKIRTRKRVHTIQFNIVPGVPASKMRQKKRPLRHKDWK